MLARGVLVQRDAMHALCSWRTHSQAHAGECSRAAAACVVCVCLQVPPGHVWLQGDNLVLSRDSREYGPVPLALMKGRVVAQVRAAASGCVGAAGSAQERARAWMRAAPGCSLHMWHAASARPQHPPSLRLLPLR